MQTLLVVLQKHLLKPSSHDMDSIVIMFLLLSSVNITIHVIPLVGALQILQSKLFPQAPIATRMDLLLDKNLSHLLIVEMFYFVVSILYLLKSSLKPILTPLSVPSVMCLTFTHYMTISLFLRMASYLLDFNY